ncbi:MAG: hypothetical protein JXM69_00750 [Anaerolineae bacterium]|nr:hypothetical protein [Anaerolineae bacterium]
MSDPKGEVKARLNIVDLVSETVTLKKSGASYTGFCPFHNNNNTPALAVFPETNTWHCFGSCGDGGDIFSWVMRRDNLDFKAALEMLAEKANVNLNGHEPKTSKRPYGNLADYAQAHGVTAEVFKSSGWSETTHAGRPALVIKTDTGPRWRFVDGNDPTYIHGRGYRRCWYRLKEAVALAKDHLIICNGEASAIVGQHYGLAAVCLTSGSEKPTIPTGLLKELQAAYTGPILVALDCDQAGRTKAPKLAQFLAQAGYRARAVDLALGNNGQDLADFCKLHGQEAAAKLQTLNDVTPQASKKDHPEGKPKTADYMATLQKLGYSFRLNALDDTIEVNQTPITDLIADEILGRMWDIGYTKYQKMIEVAYGIEAKNNPYHPIKTYLELLTYDGLSHIDTLATYFTDTQGIFGLWLKKWLVGAVAKIYQQYQNPMFVLDGAQGKGKSHFAAWLCPLNDHFVESAIQPENNDHRLLLATTWLWEVSELGATTRKADREALKAFITVQWITARKPYGKLPIHKPAMASFIGTVNDEAGFLNDPTGSRRFLTCTLTRIDWDYTQILVHDIWAEAYHLYQSGYNWQLTPSEKKLQAEINEHYEVEDPLIPEILRHYAQTGNPDDFVSSSEVLLRMGLDHLNRGNTMRLAQAMKKLGVNKGKPSKPDDNGQRPNGYFGLKSMTEEKAAPKS